MVRLKQIEKKEDSVTCTVFVEDCKEPVFLSLDIQDGEWRETKLPEGYEWCHGHLAKAKYALLDMLDSGKWETSKTIMWY